ncbi:Os10g0378150 [Oryza sativa Japonica Group]|uniref:Os10g0378150 protein n=1 Tax=Oryza sativa subsp. japonica TaxID=39947 RepID=C7J7C0_ORYSJ|nr:Os10g0378150 [Oryza sativa Japonica Group]|eukprot:NP_001176127.1 Os10g0378150 [Oryza sativa Japonica Group]
MEHDGELQPCQHVAGADPLAATEHLVVYRSISFAQKWKVFLKEEERKALEDWLEAILDKLKQDIKSNSSCGFVA